MTILTEGARNAAFAISEAPDYFSRDEGTVVSGATVLKGGTILGRIVAGAAVGAAVAGGTGDGTITVDGTDPTLAGAQEGVYTAICIAIGTNTGTFEVNDPSGNSLGQVIVGATFANQIKFVINDGATDFALLDAFTITIAAGSGNYLAYDPTATTGAEQIAGILFVESVGTVKRTIVTRAAQVTGSDLIYQDGADAAAKLVANNALVALGIIVR
jgi:hypothetical protein